MNHTSSKNPQIQKLLEKCHKLLTYIEIVLCWIPSHIGIQGNEMVDKQAKTSLSLEPSFFKISFSNFKPSINKYEEQPQCVGCDAPFTVRHFLLECGDCFVVCNFMSILVLQSS